MGLLLTNPAILRPERHHRQRLPRHQRRLSLYFLCLPLVLQLVRRYLVQQNGHPWYGSKPPPSQQNPIYPDPKKCLAAQQYGVKYCASAGVTLSTPPATSAWYTMYSNTSSAAWYPKTSAYQTSAYYTSSAAAPSTTYPATTVPTTEASKTASSSVQTFTGVAAQLGYNWALLGIGGALALGNPQLVLF